MRGANASRRSTRHRIYSVFGFIAVIVIGAVAIGMLHGATRRRVGKIFRDPERALYDVVAPKQTLFKRTHGRFGNLQELVSAGHLADELVGGPVEGFRYRVTIATVDSFVVTAEPEGPEPPPDVPPGAKVPVALQPAARRYRYFRIDQTWQVRAEESKPTTPESPVVFSPRDAAFR